MEAYEMQSCSPSTQIITNSQELEDGVAGMGLKSNERRVCRIAFEEYLDIWMKIATTNPELLKGSDSLDEFIRYTERCAVNNGPASSDKDCLIQMQRNITADPPDSWSCSGFRWPGTLGARNGRTGGMDSFSLFERIG
ncbi:uncharacterized protein LOC143717142 isoform X2 [Siphateles boraxobius]|uniref:uncharacterized protein LOC143717142 isoform X2 n=1 Tax=Siphateles boraxobius TaxID=180520 RepID=UPI004063AEFF